MTTQEASEKLKNASYFSTLGDNRKVVEMAIRSLEAWNDLKFDVYGEICKYECLNSYRTNAFYNGRVEGMKMIYEIINKHLNEVKNER